jgi:propanediol utilization protein
VRERKERVLINAEISSLAMDELLVQVSFDAATMCVAETWDANKDSDLIIAQSNAHIQLAKVYVEYLLEEDIEIGHKDLVTVDDD